MASADYTISYSDLKALMENEKRLLLVDVRSKPEHQNGHIPGSINIPLDSIDHDLSLDPDAFKAKFGMAKPPADASYLIFHCQLGRRGEIATKKARSLGFINARNYAGAYAEWSQKERK